MSNKSNSLFSTTLLFLVLIHNHHHHHRSAAQSTSPASSPGPADPPNVYKILTKAGQFSVLIRLLKSTKVGDQINNELAGGGGGGGGAAGLTFLAPTDNAFSGLESGTLNRLSDQQKVQLIQFHLIPAFVSLQNFQTLTNPIQTQASDTYQYPLNVTTDGGSQVNITTGVVTATLSGTVYSDDQLAVYQVDKVLQPLGIFDPRPPPPAPAPEPPSAAKKKKRADSDDDLADGPDSDSSAATADTATCVGIILMSGFSLLVFVGWS